MNVSEARAAIEAILAAIDDDELPEFDKVELQEGQQPCVWFGGTGRHLGSAKSSTGRDPLVYRRTASLDAVHLEMTCRADRRFLENGDSITGIRLARKVA